MSYIVHSGRQGQKTNLVWKQINAMFPNSPCFPLPHRFRTKVKLIATYFLRETRDVKEKKIQTLTLKLISILDLISLSNCVDAKLAAAELSWDVGCGMWEAEYEWLKAPAPIIE